MAENKEFEEIVNLKKSISGGYEDFRGKITDKDDNFFYSENI